MGSNKKYNLSNIMKMAHSIFENKKKWEESGLWFHNRIHPESPMTIDYNKLFSEALKKAWEIEKERVSYEEYRKSFKRVEISEGEQNWCHNYYKNNRYNGE